MRLFIGIKTGCENTLLLYQQALLKLGSGNITDVHNLHVTLKFLGELPPGAIKKIAEAMDETESNVFWLECGGVIPLGKSGIIAAKVGGDIKTLSLLHERLETALEKRGFEKESRRYWPHITLARKFRAFDGADIRKIENGTNRFKVKEMILFESKRIEGRLVYEPLYTKKLG